MSSLKKSTVVVNLGPLIKEAARVERAKGASFIGQATQTTSYNFPITMDQNDCFEPN